MFRYLISCLIILAVLVVAASLFFPSYWVHRYDELIIRQARVYRLDEKLVWSLIYEETYFRAWKVGAADEVGLMQVTPTVAREWAKETGLKNRRPKMSTSSSPILNATYRSGAGIWKSCVNNTAAEGPRQQ